MTAWAARFYEGLTAGGAYVRCRLPARHLPAVSKPFSHNDIRYGKDDKDPVFRGQTGPAAVWQFPGHQVVAVLIAGLQEQGVRVIVEADDNYLVPAPSSNVYEHPDWVDLIADDPSKPSCEAHRRIVELADAVIVSTEWLADRYREHNPNVFVCPNAVDPQDWPEPQPYDGTLRVGWAASDSHYPDAPLVRRALQWVAKQPEMQAIGYGNLFRILKQRGEWKFKLKVASWTDVLDDYRFNLAFLDVALCPLKDNEWSKGKSDLKALEAAMAGALPIVSKAEAYRGWWDNPDAPCLVAESAGGFEEAVRWCDRNRDEVKEMGARAREYVLNERSFPLAVLPWQEALREPAKVLAAV